MMTIAVRQIVGGLPGRGGSPGRGAAGVRPRGGGSPCLGEPVRILATEPGTATKGLLINNTLIFRVGLTSPVRGCSSIHRGTRGGGGWCVRRRASARR